MRTLLLVLVLVLLSGGAHWAQAAESQQLLADWLSAQSKVKTWTADFKQTRTFKALTEALESHGKVWFAAPDHFRWELGAPAQTIVVRQPNQLTILYPKLKRAEQFALNQKQARPWSDVLALLEAGFPRNQADLEARFRIVSTETDSQSVSVTLQPRSVAARKMITLIRIEFDPRSFSLLQTDLQFSDGSKMSNEFRNAKLNPELEPDLFAPKIHSDYQVVNPLEK